MSRPPPSPVIMVRSALFATGLRRKRSPSKGPKRHRTSTRRVPEEPREGLPQGRFLLLSSHPPLHLPPSTHTTTTSVATFGTTSTRTVSLVETQRARASSGATCRRSDESVHGRSTRGSPSRWHWPRRPTTARRSGGATRLPTGTASREPKSFDVMGSKGRSDYLIAFRDATQH